MNSRQLVTAGVCTAGLLAVLAAAATAQPRPLRTEDPESIGAGLIAVQVGIDYRRDLTFPVSGLRGHHTNVPSLGFRFGYGVTELQLEHLSRQHLRIVERRPAPLSAAVTATGATTLDFDDMVVGAKVRMLSETASRPSLGMHFATRLPNANTRSGLGPNTMAFHNSVLVGKTVGRVRVVGNIGLGILGDPTHGTRQNDVLLYGLSVTHTVSEAWQVVGEVNGFRNTRPRNVPPGTSTTGYGRAGLRYRRGDVQLDGAVLFGLQDRDAAIGVTTGLTLLLPGFTH